MNISPVEVFPDMIRIFSRRGKNLCLCLLSVLLCVSSVPLPAPRNLRVYDETSSSMRVSWEAADGATGYLLFYTSVNASEPQLRQEVRMLHGLSRNIIRSLSIYQTTTESV